MNLIIFISLLYNIPEQNYFVYQDSVPENIEYCVHLIHNPLKQEEFKKQWCSIETTNAYIMTVKQGS